MNIEHISVSRSNIWKTCEQQYKYKYHLKISPDGDEPYFFTYGKMIHKIAEEYVLADGNIALSEITHKVINGEIPIEERPDGSVKYAPPIPQNFKDRMGKHLHNILDLTTKVGTGGLAEWKFRYDLDPPHERYITGVIDRLIPGEKYFIIDYKTTQSKRWKKNSGNVIYDTQLRCYARVVQREFNLNANQIYAGLYYLEDGKMVGAKFSEASLEAVEQELLTIYKDIENTHADNAYGRVGDHCSFCDYRSICPFYSLT